MPLVLSARGTNLTAMKPHQPLLLFVLSVSLFFSACEPQTSTKTTKTTTADRLKPMDGIPLCPPIINYDRPPKEIGLLADVADIDLSENYYAIPEIIAEGAHLSVDMHAYYQEYTVGPDHVWLRTYDAEQGDDVEEPVGPTIRVQKNTRLTLRVHNDLPLNENWNYLFMLDNTEENAKLLDDGPSQELIDVLNKANDEEVERRSGSATGMINFKSPNDMTVDPDPDDPENMWRITANDSAMIVKRKRNWARGETAIFVYLEFYPDNSNVAQDFNNTNMHFHGSHVSPFQDDVLRYVNPTYSSYYTYDLDNHQAGTFWYHPHVHGSTAIQVASGMSGVIIVEEDNLDEYPALKAASDPSRERVMVFDQLQYDTINGELTDFEMLTLMGGFNGSQIAGARGTVINGRIKPQVAMQAGEVARWRLLHKGFHDNLALRFPDEVEVYQIAVDGIMFDEPRPITSLHMAPGNRSDILVKVPLETEEAELQIKSVSYIPACEYFPGDDDCTAGAPEDAEGMLSIKVSGKMDQDMGIPASLPTRAEELQKDIDASEITNTRNTDFTISGGVFMVNGEAFDGNRIDNKPIVETKEQWNVSGTGHPYHIHINPFQVVEFAGRPLDFPMWKDVVFVNRQTDLPEENAVIYTHYHKYWGDFVMHCHILDHEDQGMMQRVTIVRNPEDSDVGTEPEETEVAVE